MKSNWKSFILEEFVEINPRESLNKGSKAKKISMDKLQPFCKKIPGYELEEYTGGAKFRNDDTIMARITPCLENGKTAMVDVLENGEVGFGSTEYIVFRAKEGISDSDYIYYLITSPYIRDIAIKSMVGSSGRQRVQTDVLQKVEIKAPILEEQRKIAGILKNFDDKIALNNKINDNLEQQAQTIYTDFFITNADSEWEQGHLSDLIIVKYGKDHKKLADGYYPVFGSGGIMRYVEKPLYDKESILIPRKGSLNNVMYVNTPFWSVDTMFYTEMRLPNVAKYVYHFVKSKDLASMNAGSAVPSMTTDILNAMETAIPSSDALARFESIVEPMYQAMQSNNTESAKLAEIRDTLLPKLMSGDLDIAALNI